MTHKNTTYLAFTLGLSKSFTGPVKVYNEGTENLTSDFLGPQVQDQGDT
jgi:hypothetical protein